MPVRLWCWIDTGLPDIFRAGERHRGSISNHSVITECRTRVDIGTDVEQRLKVPAIAGLSAGEVECNWQATKFSLQMNLG
jgi:hypothetical protein